VKAAVVRGKGQTPVWGEFDEPVAAEGEQLVTVAAAALTSLTKGRAAGTHYSATGEYPLVPGVDGVGRLADGNRVYFVMPRAPFGAMAERTVVRARQCIPVPEGLGEVEAAALANPGMSCWAAFAERAHLAAGETVLINGATGTAGRLAVQVARHMGAAKVIATGRNQQALAAAGADAAVPLVGSGEALESSFSEHFAAGVDVVLDYLWGPSAEAILRAAAKHSPETKPVRFVQVGTAAAPEIQLPGAVLRSSGIVMMGSGIGSVPFARLLETIGEVFRASLAAKFQIEVKTVPLAEVADAWDASDSRERTVFVL
jgi:NADPH:quinone reductase-like Zn-dependent oxidoreductase